MRTGRTTAIKIHFLREILKTKDPFTAFLLLMCKSGRLSLPGSIAIQAKSQNFPKGAVPKFALKRSQ